MCPRRRSFPLHVRNYLHGFCTGKNTLAKPAKSIWVKLIDIQWIVLKLTEIVSHVFSTARVAKLKKFSVFLSMLRFSRNICYVCINTLREYYFIIFVWSLWQYIQKNMRPINLHGRLWWNPLWLSRVNLHFACVIFGLRLVSYYNFFYNYNFIFLKANYYQSNVSLIYLWKI